MPCPGPFHFSHSVDYIYEFCPLPDPDVGPSICDVEHTSSVFCPGLKKGMVLLEEKGHFCSRNDILRALSRA